MSLSGIGVHHVTLTERYVQGARFILLLFLLFLIKRWKEKDHVTAVLIEDGKSQMPMGPGG